VLGEAHLDREVPADVPVPLFLMARGSTLIAAIGRTPAVAVRDDRLTAGQPGLVAAGGAITFANLTVAKAP
jgi:hypothetical protein